MIDFQKNGTKLDGKIKWKITNPDGSEHQHKVKQEEKPSNGGDYARMHFENMEANRALIQAINGLTNAINTLAKGVIR